MAKRDSAAENAQAKLEAFKRWEAEQQEERNKKLAAVEDAAREEVEELVTKLREIYQLFPAVVSSAVREFQPAKRGGNGEGGRQRLGRVEIQQLVDALPNKLKGKMSRSEIAAALGIQPTQVATILKKAAAAGHKVGNEGERANAVYFLK
jgi:hypothetical protein